MYVLVHYAVIDGVEQPRVETTLPVSVPMGGLYKIRFEAGGKSLHNLGSRATGGAMDRSADFRPAVQAFMAKGRSNRSCTATLWLRRFQLKKV